MTQPFTAIATLIVEDAHGLHHTLPKLNGPQERQWRFSIRYRLNDANHQVLHVNQ